MTRIFCLLLLFIANCTFSQHHFDYRNFTKKMCSPEFHGRGYVNEGDYVAAKHIRKQMNQLGIDSLSSGYFQPFNLEVNTFPDSCSIHMNNQGLTPGLDYMIDPTSNGTCMDNKCKGARNFDSKHIEVMDMRKLFEEDWDPNRWRNYDDETLYVIDNNVTEDSLSIYAHQVAQNMSKYYDVIELVNTKFTWSVKSKAKDRLYIQMKKNIFDSLLNDQMNIKIHLHNKHLVNYESNNVVGHIPAKKKAKGTIMITAHYDHLGRMGTDTYFPGANDNASGVAMLLQLGEMIKSRPIKRYHVLLVAFAGEEAGLIGSKHMSENPLCDIAKVRFLLNLDIMGSGEEGITAVNGRVFIKEFKLLQKMNRKVKAVPVVKARGKAANSDHYFFTEKGVRSFFIYTMGENKNYHDIYDTYENLSFSSFEGLSKLFDAFLRRF
ncbi:MAG: M28 family peptidase [Crocinitomicaceae bacterium]|nr:M28 family peptidase [Crocinitomicaceae bacterium]